MRNSLSVIALLAATVPGVAHAQACDPVFLSSDQAATIDGIRIEPGAVATRDIFVRVANDASVAGSGGGTCPATIRIARISPPPGPNFPVYTLRGPGNRQIEILPDRASAGTASSDIAIANAPQGPQGRAVKISVAVSTEWGLSAGTYVDELEVLLIDDTGNIETTKLTVTIIVPAAVSLRLVGAILGGGPGAPAQVDLGTLSSERRTQADNFAARIFSTGQYSVRLTSSNNGRLGHEAADENIPYRLYFDGQLADLGSGAEFSYLGPTPRAGDLRPMRISVEPVVALAGRYSDRISVTVTAM